MFPQIGNTFYEHWEVFENNIEEIFKNNIPPSSKYYSLIKEFTLREKNLRAGKVY